MCSCVSGWWGLIRPYMVIYTDMRHGRHVVCVAFDLCMHAVCCVVRVG